MLQPIFADAAGERRHAVVGDDHAAVAAGERQHRQQVGLDRSAAKVRLEGEQVARRACSRRAARSDGSGSHEPCAATTSPLRAAVGAGRRAEAQAKCAGAALDRLQRARLEARRAGRPGGVGEQGVELLSAERPAPAPRRPSPPGSAATLVSPPRSKRDPAQLGAGATLDLGADTEGIEQREVARGDALAADLAPRKAWRSISATDQPARASRIAAAEPAGPAPTIATSNARRHDAARAARRRSSG